MRKFTTLKRSQLIASSAAAAAVALRGPAVLAQSAAPLLPIHIGAVPIESSGEGYYGSELGFFKRAGFEPEIQTMSNAGALVSAVLSGAMEFAPTNVVTMSQAYAKGLPLVYIAPGAVYSDKDPTTELAVAASSPYRAAADLNGKKIGVLTLSGFLQVAIQNWLDKNGGDPKSVTFLELPTSEIVPALLAKRIDAGGLPEPYRSMAAPNTDIRFIGAPYSSVGKDLMLSAWVANRAYVAANPAVVRKFIGAVRDSAVWANAHHRESAAILSKYTRVPVAVIEGMRRDPFALRTDPGTIQPIIDVCAKYGLIPRRFAATELFAPNIT